MNANSQPPKWLATLKSVGLLALSLWGIIPTHAQSTIPLPRPNPYLVSITTEKALAAEADPAQIAVFRISRTGAPTLPMEVWFSVSGDAERGKDFHLIPESMFTPCPECDRAEVILQENHLTIPAGAGSVLLGLRAIPDNDRESTEKVGISLILAPESDTAIALPRYGVGLPSSAVAAIVDGPLPAASLTFLSPKPGTEFKSGHPIAFSLSAVDPNGSIRHVEYYANGDYIGRTDILTRDVDIPGKPRFHEFEWQKPPQGKHSVQAYAKDALGNKVVSDPLPIVVLGPVDSRPTLTLRATDSSAQEKNPADIAIFEISRADGNLRSDAKVYFSTDGSAKRGADYVIIPESMFIPCELCMRPEIIIDGNFIILPAGAQKIRLGIRALNDSAIEGEESVVLRLSTPPNTLLPYQIGTPNEDKISILEAPLPPPPPPILPEVFILASDAESLESDPKDLLTFAVHRSGDAREELTVYLALEGDAKFGIDYLRVNALPIDAGPVPVFEKNDASVTFPPGVISTLVQFAPIPDKALEGNETVLVELTQPIPPPNVRIRQTYTIGKPSSARGVISEKPVSASPSITILSPASGKEFPEGADIEVVAVAIDPKGYLPNVVLYANDKAVAESSIQFIRAPDPGTPIQHTLRWKNVPAGQYSLSVQTPPGALPTVKSDLIKILVRGNPNPGTLPSVSVISPDPTAAEPRALGPDGKELPDGDTATFVFRRTGSLSKPLVVYYKLAGTAKNGTDYSSLDGDATIAAGSAERTITVKPKADRALEGPETVILTLQPHPSYAVAEMAPPTVTIADAQWSAKDVAALAITEPDGNESFKAPAKITIEAVAIDQKGAITLVEFYANGAKIGVSDRTCPTCDPAVTPGQPLEHSFTWEKVEAGDYTLVARAKSSAGQTIESSPVKIRVALGPLEPFVKRDLPEAYRAGQPFIVTLKAHPPVSVKNYALEDQPPKDWTVSKISDGGDWDAANNKVKFGPVFDTAPQTFTYTVTPPANATRTATFEGTTSADGQSLKIAGESSIKAVLILHPADANPANQSLSLNELTEYGAAWKAGKAWPTGPNPIPVSFVTRAGALWKGGEDYLYDPSAGPAPLYWVNRPAAKPADLAAALVPRLARGLATAEWSERSPKSGSLTLVIQVVPGPNTASYAIEEELPRGAQVVSASDDASIDPESGIVRWGPFHDSKPRKLTLELSDVRQLDFHGIASFDGRELPLRHQPAPQHNRSSGESPSGPRIGRVERHSDGSVELLVIQDGPSSNARIEFSNDLNRWFSFDETDSPESSVHLDLDAEETETRFYRITPR